MVVLLVPVSGILPSAATELRREAYLPSACTHDHDLSIPAMGRRPQPWESSAVLSLPTELLPPCRPPTDHLSLSAVGNRIPSCPCPCNYLLTKGLPILHCPKGTSSLYEDYSDPRPPPSPQGSPSLSAHTYHSCLTQGTSPKSSLLQSKKGPATGLRPLLLTKTSAGPSGCEQDTMEEFHLTEGSASMSIHSVF